MHAAAFGHTSIAKALLAAHAALDAASHEDMHTGEVAKHFILCLGKVERKCNRSQQRQHRI